VRSVSRADENTPYQFVTLNNGGVITRENLQNSNIHENTFSNSAVQSDDRDCSALIQDVTLFNACEGEDSARLWRQTKIMFVAGFIALLPEDISRWDKSEYSRGDPLKKWYENV
jgi:hypothetical protein